MTALYVLSGFAVSLLALAVLGYALGYLVRSLAMFLPPAGQFLGTVTDLREQQVTSAQMPGMAGAAPLPAWPIRRTAGVAPPPVDTTSVTDFAGPPSQPGDRDFFPDQETLDMIAQAQRPTTGQAPGPTLHGQR